MTMTRQIRLSTLARRPNTGDKTGQEPKDRPRPTLEQNRAARDQWLKARRERLEAQRAAHTIP